MSEGNITNRIYEGPKTKEKNMVMLDVLKGIQI